MDISYVKESYTFWTKNSKNIRESEKIFVVKMLGDNDFLDFAMTELTGDLHYLAKTLKRFIKDKEYFRVKESDRLLIAEALLDKYTVSEICHKIYGENIIH